MLNADQARSKLETYENGKRHKEEWIESSPFSRGGLLQTWMREWYEEKRPLTEEEIVGALWLKIGRHGRNLLVRPSW